MKTLQVFGLWLGLSVHAIAGDVGSFDIGGVRLGMAPAEAKAALQSKCQRDSGKFDVMSVQRDNPYLLGKKYAPYMRCKAPASETTVHILAVPSGALVVERVIYSMPWNRDNEKALRESALAKYGEPTNTILMDATPEWCIDPSPTFKGGPMCNGAGGPNLRVVRADLVLYDPRYSKQVWAARQTSETFKPSL